MSSILFLPAPSSNFLHNSTSIPPKINIFSTFNHNRKDDKIKVKSCDPDDSFSAEVDLGTKLPSAPWMKRSPVVVEEKKFSKSRNDRNFRSDEGEENEGRQSLTERVRGGRGKKAMHKIFRGIGKLQESCDLDESEEFRKSPDQIKLDFLMGGFEEDEFSGSGEQMPWERDERIFFRRVKKEKVVTAAELSLDSEVLERLRGEAAKMKKWIKVKQAGVTWEIVSQIRCIWRNNELVMLKFDLPLCRNMDRAREIVEFKTGGLVVWSKKDAHVIYRGSIYQYPKPYIRKIDKLGTNEGKEEIISIDGSLYEREADRLLDGLGPRFIDWWRPNPLPVDADLLAEVVPEFRPPFRLCPPKTRSKLTDDELTYLRRLSRPLPTHFVLGRNRKLQGLAAAILKLWEKCHIAKIALKLGVPNTNNAEMADELKCLTGGVLILRNKFIIIIYRGKDFLPCRVANLVVERELELRSCQLQEEAARAEAIENICLTVEPSNYGSTVGSLSEFQDIQSDSDLEGEDKKVNIQFEAEKRKLEKELRQQKHNLSKLKMKIGRSSRNLLQLNSAWKPAALDSDQEIVTPEERECLRKIGLKMDSTLVLGRRGVFDGVIEGLHQHWKHKEVVKVITKQKVFSHIVNTAKLLQRQSGGILISVEKLKEGHAIILYRGKNYRRPLKLVSPNLLNKREALERSLEMQRVGSLKHFAYQRERAISDLKRELAEVQEEK
ncbi:chloroplastic group IIA intron splicing facilitator CRS1, chloroplastic isoform X2 [Apium graveolens]|uniref:chloroplastic group IIA intron splicing facilitator CRS1, chloroplastic isoform X2 n=1 Tax=Apium graveolens TaxID=4045 RepID=UPI003D7A0841